MFNKIYVNIKNNIKKIIPILIFLILFIVLNIDLPYTLYMKGGMSNLSKKISVVDENINTGEYNALYVLSSKVNVFTYLISKFRSDMDLVCNEKDYDENFNINKLLLINSKNNALKLAYDKAGKNYKILKNNLYVFGDYGDIKSLERLEKIDGIDIDNIDTLKKSLYNKDEVELLTTYKNKTYKRKIKLKYENEEAKLGINLINVEDIEFSPNIKILIDDNESGSSSGLMLALTIYDKLVDDDISNGLKIIGTGSLDLEGNIKPIDGLKYKMLGLKGKKYDVFFIPYENKEEANSINKKYNLNLDFVPVKTFDEAIYYLLNVKK